MKFENIIICVVVLLTSLVNIGADLKIMKNHPNIEKKIKKVAMIYIALK